MSAKRTALAALAIAAGLTPGAVFVYLGAKSENESYRRIEEQRDALRLERQKTMQTNEQAGKVKRIFFYEQSNSAFLQIPKRWGMTVEGEQAIQKFIADANVNLELLLNEGDETKIRMEHWTQEGTPFCQGTLYEINGKKCPHIPLYIDKNQ